MTKAEQLHCLSAAANVVNRRYGISKAAQQERRVKSVYGNLAIERPDLKIEQVKQALGRDRSDQ
ncbi:MAG: hypothetical protein ACYC1C_17890 [Chloroflexota bacterium]